MFWDGEITRVAAGGAEVTVIAGRFGDVEAPPPPPGSWAARPDSDVAIWHVRLDPGASVTLPPANGDGAHRVLYVFEGDTLTVGDRQVGNDTGVVLRADAPAPLTAGGAEVEALLLQG